MSPIPPDSFPPGSGSPAASAMTAERRKLAALVGTRENASLLFRPKISGTDLEYCGALLLQPLNFSGGTNLVATDFARMSESDLAEWGSRCWANTIAHLAENDAEVQSTLTTHGTSLPNEGAAQGLLLGKVNAAFLFFLWILASPARPWDPQNSCYVKIIVLTDVILLENLQAKRDGVPGGRGLIDKTLRALRDVANGFGIRRIKAVATNERVYRALLRRGFRDRAEVAGFARHVENYAMPVELVLS